MRVKKTLRPHPGGPCGRAHPLDSKVPVWGVNEETAWLERLRAATPAAFARQVDVRLQAVFVRAKHRSLLSFKKQVDSPADELRVGQSEFLGECLKRGQLLSTQENINPLHGYIVHTSMRHSQAKRQAANATSLFRCQLKQAVPEA